MKKFGLTVMATALLVASGASYAEGKTFVEGKDYYPVPRVGQVDVPNKIEVREFFWYGCPHCHALEPHMQAWLRKLPNDVNFVRTPAVMGHAAWEMNARGYFVSEALGIRRKAHLPLFYAIHEGRQALSDQQSLAQFYTKYGADVNKFNSLFNSFAITGKINQAKNLAIHYQLSGVPAVVVNGKYIVQGETQHTVDTIQFLVEKERQAMKTAKKAS